MSAAARSTGSFYGELLLGVVSDVGGFFIEAEREGIGRGSVAVSLAKIVFVTG